MYELVFYLYFVHSLKSNAKLIFLTLKETKKKKL